MISQIISPKNWVCRIKLHFLHRSYRKYSGSKSSRLAAFQFDPWSWQHLEAMQLASLANSPVLSAMQAANIERGKPGVKEVCNSGDPGN